MITSSAKAKIRDLAEIFSMLPKIIEDAEKIGDIADFTSTMEARCKSAAEATQRYKDEIASLSDQIAAMNLELQNVKSSVASATDSAAAIIAAAEKHAADLKASIESQANEIVAAAMNHRDTAAIILDKATVEAEKIVADANDTAATAIEAARTARLEEESIKANIAKIRDLTSRI